MKPRQGGERLGCHGWIRCGLTVGEVGSRVWRILSTTVSRSRIGLGWIKETRSSRARMFSEDRRVYCKQDEDDGMWSVVIASQANGAKEIRFASSVEA